MHRGHDTRQAARRAAWACAVTLAVALGIGRFAFTPLLPRMLQDGSLSLQDGGWLASLNYGGYFIGAMSCAVMPFDHRRILRFGLVATVALTAAMGLFDTFALWAPVRLAGGVVSAWAFVFASQWGLRRLAELRQPDLGGVIFTGPGLGILVTGLLAGAAAHVGARAGWLIFAGLALLLSVAVWRIFDGSEPSAAAHDAATQDRQNRHDRQAGQTEAVALSPASADTPAVPAVPEPLHLDTQADAPQAGDAAWLVALYGLAGFGYIITATFLPVIARHALPGSPWPAFFWPMFGAAIMIGALGAARLPLSWDNRLMLSLCYLLQAGGILLGVAWPSVAGFAGGSVLIGLPFTAITLFAMREARRLKHNQAAGLMGFATASYGAGQIAGPLVAAPLAARTGSFSLALGLAAGALLLGAVLLFWVWLRARRR